MEERSNRSHSRLERIGWSVGALVLAVLAVPWFLWRDSTVIAGLPLWLWWHIGWMALASMCFAAFTRYGWGVGVTSVDEPRSQSEVKRDG